MNKLYSMLEKINIKKEDILPLIASIVITTVAMFDSAYLNNQLLILLWVLIVIILMSLVWFIFLKASFTVLKSFFFLNAELSLMIFLAQSYCAVPNHTADNELKIFVGTSIFYISYKFLQEIKYALETRLNSISEKGWPWEKIIVASLFLLFVFILICVIYKIINPIIFNLCIYK